jgi:putative aldouronate transport system substrate-binding protein
MKKTINVRRLMTLVSCLVMAALVAMAFAGCKKESSGGESGTTRATTKQTTTGKQTSTAEEIVDIDAQPKPVLKGLVAMGGALVHDVGTGPAYEAIAEKTGYQLKLDVYQPDQMETSVNMAMASKQDYDFIRGATATMLFNYIQNKAIAPLTESIEKYGSDLKTLFTDDMWYELTFDDGEIYGIPSLGNPRIWNSTAIRTDWLEELSLPVPVTLDDFVNVLREFKQKDPGGVGTDKVIPFSTSLFSGNAIDYDPFLSAYGITYPWNVRDGKMVHRIELPEFKEYVEYYRRLYSEGLLDADIAVNKDDTLQEKVNKGLVGLVRYNYYYMNLTWDLWEGQGIEWDLNFIKNPVGKNGEQGQQVDTSLGVNYFVPATSKNVDHVVNYANKFAQNYEYLLIGEEGVHWEMRDGKRVPILPTFNDERGDIFFYQPVMSGAIEYPLWLVRVNKVENMGKAYAQVMSTTEGYTQVNPLAYALNLPVTSKYSASLEKMINDTVLRIVVGDLPIEELDNLRDKWKREGGDESTEEVNSWYEKKYKK